MEKWNDGDGLTVKERKRKIFTWAFVCTLVVLLITFAIIKVFFSESVEAYIAAAALILTIDGYVLNMTNDLIAEQKGTDLVLYLNIETKSENAIITCSVENKSLDRINEMNFYLFIDQPIFEESSGIYQVNYVLKHYCDKYNCKFSLLCKNKMLNSYPDEYKLQNDLFYGYKELEYLTPEGIMYINPGERFSEDVVFKLKKGVYRAILIGIFGKDRGKCICANKQFIIE